MDETKQLVLEMLKPSSRKMIYYTSLPDMKLFAKEMVSWIIIALIYGISLFVIIDKNEEIFKTIIGCVAVTILYIIATTNINRNKNR